MAKKQPACVYLQNSGLGNTVGARLLLAPESLDAAEASSLPLENLPLTQSSRCR